MPHSTDVIEALLRDAQQANDADRLQTAEKQARKALALVVAGAAPRPRLHARILRTLSYSAGRLGRTDEALAHLADALRLDPDQEPELAAARGVLLMFAGRSEEAVAALDLAIPMLSSGDPLAYVSALLNRGVAHMEAGRLSLAETDTAGAARWAIRSALGPQIGFAEFNLGYIRYLRGDLCGALAAMSDAAVNIPVDAQGVPDLDRARILQAAGLVSEAEAFAHSARQRFAANRAVRDLAAATLVAADIALLAGDLTRSRALARRSATLSRRRNHHVNRLLAELIELRGMVSRDGDAPRRLRRTWEALALKAFGLSGDFAARGFEVQAAAARLTAAESLLLAGDVDGAATAVASAPLVSSHSEEVGAAFGLQLHRALVSGRILMAEGSTEAGFEIIRGGLDDLARFQASFGSQDLQSAASIHGRGLGALGLETAVRTGEPEPILEWLDRSRAVTTRLTALRPPDDPELAADLGALRVAAESAYQARVNGGTDVASESKVAQLRSRVRSRAWTAGGGGAVEQPVSFATATAALAQDHGRQFLALFSGAGNLHSVTVTHEGATYRTAGPLAPVLAAVRRAAADLNVLAMPRIPTTIRAVAQRSLTAELDFLGAQLLPPEIADGDALLSVVAGGEIATLPWNLLPALRGRPVRVSSSTTAAVRSAAVPVGHSEMTLLAVQGPDVPRADSEIAQVQRAYPNTRVLAGIEATGAALVSSLENVDLLHIAAHGIHEPDNPQFSGIRLHGGPLYAYDLGPLPHLPGQVVLSSCDVGRSTDRPGGEPLGLTAALLRFGVPIVIAGTARIADDVAAEVMGEYHRRFASGMKAEAALAAAIASTDGYAPLTCFGG